MKRIRLPKSTAPAPVPFPRLTTAEIFVPVAPLVPLITGFGLYPGPVTIIGGVGFGGKTVVSMSLALGVASGSPVWGGLECRRATVSHFDDEQGRPLTCERYQRLLRAADLTVGDLGDRLQLIVRPPVRLDAPDSAATWAREMKGSDLAIFDSFRSLCPSLDENKSDSRRVLDMLGEVSEQTGCAVLVIHHARKPTRDSVGGARTSLRGTGAFFDSAGGVWVLSRKHKDGPARLTHEKDRFRGVLSDDLGIIIDDVSADGDDRWGLSVTLTDPGTADSDCDDGGNGDVATLTHEVVAYLRANGPATKSAVAKGVGRNKGAVCRAIDSLVNAGAVLSQGRNFALSAGEEVR